VGQATSGYWSWVDRLWSVAPAVYAGFFAWYSPGNPRLMLMAALSGLWAVRLTFNFWRKGGYGDEEDYRWAVVRGWFAKHDPLHPLGRELFSLAFVALYQHALLWLLAAPAASRVLFFAAASSESSSASPSSPGGSSSGALGAWDYALTLAFLAFLFLETCTDEHQWAFQRAKYALTPAQRERAGGDLARGFATGGPFRYSRHLNYFSEQMLWWTFYGFSVVAGAPGGDVASLASEALRGGASEMARALVNPAALGPFLLSLLFLGSTDMTERLTKAKYPAYSAYQRTTSRLAPWTPGPSLDSPRGVELVATARARAQAEKRE